MPRPHAQLSIDELEVLVGESRKGLDAIRAELRARRTARAKQLLKELQPPEPVRDHFVYVIELAPAVWDDKKFRDRNPDQDPTERPCLYVGMTSTSPEERFDQHRRGHKAARLVRKFGVKLRREFYERLNPMTRDEAEREEPALAASLERAGYAVWWN